MTAATASLLVGSGNRKKLEELSRLLAGAPIRLLLPKDLDPIPPPPPEDGATFEENAASKALAYARASGHWCLADDSGLEVDALGGRPGVHSARWSGEGATDASNNARLLRELAGVPDGKRGARYVSVVALASPEGLRASARGECEGRILDAPRGGGGFGYDPLFLVSGLATTFAELSPEEKERISHRGRAFRRLLPELLRILTDAPTTAP